MCKDQHTVDTMYAAIKFITFDKLSCQGCITYKTATGRLSVSQLDTFKVRLTITDHVVTLVKDATIDEFDYILSDIIDFDKEHHTMMFNSDKIEHYYILGGVYSYFKYAEEEYE